MEPLRSRILKERDNPQLLDKTLPNLHITRPRDKTKDKKIIIPGHGSTVKYKSYGDPHPNVLKVNHRAPLSQQCI